MCAYSGGRSFLGHFSFATEYCNRLAWLGRELSVSADRIFTLPAEQGCRLTLRRRNAEDTLEVGAADSFSLFLQEVTADIERHACERHRAALLSDARVLGRLRTIAGEDCYAD